LKANGGGFNHNGNKIFVTYSLNTKSRRSNCNLGYVGTLPGIIGTMMAQETLKLMDLPTLENELVLFNTLDWVLKLKF
jgi:adenylyltransferase/sulfurtransferase